jgi:hypothetical protein
MAKKSEKPKENPLRTFPMDYSKIEMDLTQMIQNDELPQCFIESYGVAVVMNLLFPDESLGENFNNIWAQINKICTRWEVNVNAWQEQLGVILAKWKPVIDQQKQDQLNKILELAKTDANQS